ncbi:hypothetical protein lerEdw1_000962 [Lerista edwardsae]|nr:hypothetical protein lerEdw1_000962 [Lerista edwardsae]
MTQYVRALLQRRMVCRNVEERNQMARRMLQDASQLKELFCTLGLMENVQTLKVIADLQELISLRDPSTLSLEVLGFVKKYPDISDDHVSLLLDLRGDVSKEIRNTVLEVMAQNPQALPENYEPVFSSILVPAPELALCLGKRKQWESVECSTVVRSELLQRHECESQSRAPVFANDDKPSSLESLFDTEENRVGGGRQPQLQRVDTSQSGGTLVNWHQALLVSGKKGMELLNPHSVLVTGSNRGIGLEIVRQLVGKSNRPEWIFATCRDPEGPRAQVLKNLAAEHRGLVVVPLDVSDPSSVEAAAAQVTERLKGAGLNLLINNAGIGKPGVLGSVAPEDMAVVYQTNVVGPLTVSQAFLPLLKKASRESNQKGMSCSKAAIVNISSVIGSITNVVGWEFFQSVPYRCSKAALNMLTRCMSLGFAEDEILCVALHPGWVQTDMGNMVKSAPNAVEGNVQEILSTLGCLSEKDTNTFVSWDGKSLDF